MQLKTFEIIIISNLSNIGYSRDNYGFILNFQNLKSQIFEHYPGGKKTQIFKVFSSSYTFPIELLIFYNYINKLGNFGTYILN